MSMLFKVSIFDWMSALILRWVQVCAILRWSFRHWRIFNATALLKVEAPTKTRAHSDRNRSPRACRFVTSLCRVSISTPANQFN